MTNIPPIDAPSILPEAIEDDEMAAILRGFAERHEEFLREQERAPVCLRTSAKKYPRPYERVPTRRVPRGTTPEPNPAPDTRRNRP
jgi:hypothetical protein